MLDHKPPQSNAKTLTLDYSAWVLCSLLWTPRSDELGDAIIFYEVRSSSWIKRPSAICIFKTKIKLHCLSQPMISLLFITSVFNFNKAHNFTIVYFFFLQFQLLRYHLICCTCTRIKGLTTKNQQEKHPVHMNWLKFSQ